MKAISLKESKEIELEILKSIDAFCESHNLVYYLFFGTLLGAVRHKGFIPWDDDIDIVMPRQDYDVFMSEYYNGRYKAISCGNNQNYYLPFGKVYDSKTYLQENVKNSIAIGVYVDVFPLDVLSKNTAQNAHIKRKIARKRFLLNLNFLPGSKKRKGIKRVVHSVLCFSGIGKKVNELSRCIDSFAGSIDQSQADSKCSVLTELNSKNAELVFDVSLFGSGKRIEFEKYYFRAPTNSDAVLQILYGDYLSLPPKELRVSHHDYVSYYI